MYVYLSISLSIQSYISLFLPNYLSIYLILIWYQMNLSFRGLRINKSRSEERSYSLIASVQFNGTFLSSCLPGVYLSIQILLVRQNNYYCVFFQPSTYLSIDPSVYPSSMYLNIMMISKAE